MPRNKNKRKSSFKCFVRNKNDNSADIYFYGDIVGSDGDKWWGNDDKCPSDVATVLKDCENVSQLNIYVNSNGGDVFAGNAIYNMLKRHNAYKTVYVDGLAASIASVIVMAGDEIIMPANSYLMIHKAWTYAMGNANDLRETADRLENIEQTIVDTYMENVADDVAEDDIKQKMSDETWLSAKDAAALFPKIQEDESMDVAACISSITYKNSPKNLAVRNDEEEPDEKETENQDNPEEPEKVPKEDPEEDPEEEPEEGQKENNSNEMDMLDDFVFMEGVTDYEQEDA